MTDYDQLGYYECDDEAEDGDIEFEEYYHDDQEHYPQSSSQKNSRGYYDYQNRQPYNPLSYNNQYQQRWPNDAENVSSSSIEDPYGRMPLSNKHETYETFEERKLDQVTRNYPQSNRERYFTNQDLPTQEDRELLTITVEIGNGEQENIVILNNDTAEDVAERFCDKYDMNDELRSIFTEQIAQNIEQAKQELEYQNMEYSEGLHQEHASTAIDNTPPYQDFRYPSEGMGPSNLPSSTYKSIDYSNNEYQTFSRSK